MLMSDPSEQTKSIIDLASLTTVIGTLAGALPAIAAVFTIIWTVIRIFETKTVQNFLKKFQKPRE